MKTTNDRDRNRRPNALVRFAHGVGDLVHEYNELREDARRRFPKAFR